MQQRDDVIWALQSLEEAMLKCITPQEPVR